MPQRLPLQQLHSDQGAAFVLADVMNGADIGMIEGRGGAGLALEALQLLEVEMLLVGTWRRR
jgi:hypothetical protein